MGGLVLSGQERCSLRNLKSPGPSRRQAFSPPPVRFLLPPSKKTVDKNKKNLVILLCFHKNLKKLVRLFTPMSRSLGGMGARKRKPTRERPVKTRRKRSRPARRPCAASVFSWLWTLGLLAVLTVAAQHVNQTFCEQSPIPAPEPAGNSSAATGGGGLFEPKVAIVIDDLGQDLKTGEKFLGLGVPLTYSILPYRPHSTTLAAEICRRGGEVLLHLPLEPKDYPEVNPGTGCILAAMDREEIQAEVSDQIDSLPCCVGVSSHMGSRFTEIPEVTAWMLGVVQERGLFFLDSLTTPRSVVGALAIDKRLPFVQRTLFLDQDRNVDAIVRQLCRLADHASLQGWAVGIGHPFPETLDALSKGLAAFSQKGIRLVPISALVRRSGQDDGSAGPSMVQSGGRHGRGDPGRSRRPSS